jgi:hypothetical protein
MLAGAVKVDPFAGAVSDTVGGLFAAVPTVTLEALDVVFKPVESYATAVNE